MRVSRRQSLKRFAVAGTIPWSALAAPRKLPPPIRLVVLDVGGTIIEDRGDVPEALRSAMAHHGVRSSREEIARWRGASKREIVRHFVAQQLPPPNVDRDKLIASIYDPKNGSRRSALSREVVTIVQHEQRRRGRSGSPGG